MWTLGEQNSYWQNSSATLSSEKTILKPLKHIIGVCSRHRSQTRARAKPVILHMLGSAGALLRVKWGIPRQSILFCHISGCTEEPRVCAQACLGVPSGLRAPKSFDLESATPGLEPWFLPVSYNDLQEVTCRRFFNCNMAMTMPPNILLFFFFFLVMESQDDLRLCM